jgi:calcium binding protein 39
MLPFSLFKSKPKSPHEIVKLFRDAQLRLDSTDPRTCEKASEECNKYLSILKSIAIDSNGDTNAEALAQLAQEAYSCGLLELLVTNLGRFDFEARKDVVVIFNALVRRQIGTRTPTVEYLCSHDAIMLQLLKGYERQELALNYGMMLRECLRHEALAQLLLNAQDLYILFIYVQQPTFDIASDAFATLKVPLYCNLIDGRTC